MGKEKMTRRNKIRRYSEKAKMKNENIQGKPKKLFETLFNIVCNTNFF